MCVRAEKSVKLKYSLRVLAEYSSRKLLGLHSPNILFTSQVSETTCLHQESEIRKHSHGEASQKIARQG